MGFKKWGKCSLFTARGTVYPYLSRAGKREIEIKVLTF